MPNVLAVFFADFDFGLIVPVAGIILIKIWFEPDQVSKMVESGSGFKKLVGSKARLKIKI